MCKRLFIMVMSLFCLWAGTYAQEQKSELQQKAEAADEKGNVASARFHFIRAYEDYARRGQLGAGVECGVDVIAPSDTAS